MKAISMFSRAVLIIFLIILLQGCTNPGESNLKVSILSEPLDEFQQFNITFSAIEIFYFSAFHEGGWSRVVEGPVTIDLASAKGKEALIIGETKTRTGEISMVRIQIDSVLAVEKDGSVLDIALPEKTFIINKLFGIKENTSMVIHWDSTGNLQKRGALYVLAPVFEVKDLQVIKDKK